MIFLQPSYPSKNKRLAKNREGTTFVETILAIAILAIGIAGASRLILISSKLSSITSEHSVATQLARNRVEQMDMAGFDDLPAWEVDGLVCDDEGNPDAKGNFRLTTEVTYLKTNLVEIALQVKVRNHKTWKFDRTGKTITTYLSDL